MYRPRSPKWNRSPCSLRPAHCGQAVGCAASAENSREISCATVKQRPLVPSAFAWAVLRAKLWLFPGLAPNGVLFRRTLEKKCSEAALCSFLRSPQRPFVCPFFRFKRLSLCGKFGRFPEFFAKFGTLSVCAFRFCGMPERVFAPCRPGVLKAKERVRIICKHHIDS